MNFYNLAVVFAPTLIKSAQITDSITRMMEDQKYVNIGMQILIEEYEYIFNVCKG